MKHRVATVSFLNAWPLVEYFREQPPESVSLVADLPSQLPELLFNDLADVALIPVVEYFRGCGHAIAPGVGICTAGQVDSVKLFSRVKPTEIKHVVVDRGSRT
jgi:chorismate dehydratase